MSTIIKIEVVLGGDLARAAGEPAEAVARAFDWFAQVEAACSRFVDDSEARALERRVGEPTEVSPVLFEALRFALAVAEASGGAFDPTVGDAMARRGFDIEYRSGRRAAVLPAAAEAPTYRDVVLDAARRSVTLVRPLTLDLGAVAKGLAVDMAARELEPFRHFVIDAGGDLFCAGRNSDGEPWRVGIRHPRAEDDVILVLRVSDLAVCTSGDYERRPSVATRAGHILDPRSASPADAVASATVLAPTAITADALATAAFVLGPEDGIAFLERQGVHGLIVTPSIGRYTTQGFPS
jgi:thiamine biosynthesis lipoprotein